MARNELLSRSFMLMNFAAAALIVMTQWRTNPQPAAESTAAASTPVVTSVGQDRVAPSALATPSHSGAAQAAATPATADTTTPSPTATPAGSPRLVVDLSDRQVTLYKWNKVQTIYPIGIGQPGWETPTGTFNVNHMESDPIWQHPITGQTIPAGPNNPLGSRWIGFASTEQYEIGFHATNQPNSVGKAVSHGCLRMHEDDIQDLYVQVSLGTPVTVQQ